MKIPDILFLFYIVKISDPSFHVSTTWLVLPLNITYYLIFNEYLILKIFHEEQMVALLLVVAAVGGGPILTPGGTSPGHLHQSAVPGRGRDLPHFNHMVGLLR